MGTDGLPDIYIYRKEELCLKITPDVDHPAISVVFPMSMQDPDLFKCLLVGAQSLHDWRRDPFHVNRSHEMLNLQNEAILSVRKRLSAPQALLDDGVLIAITHLMVADVSQRLPPPRRKSKSNSASYVAETCCRSKRI
jgi:hypothetical protein